MQYSVTQISIAVCDDDQAFLDTLCDTLTTLLSRYELRYTISPFTSPTQLLAALDQTDFNLLFLDIEMPEMDGMMVASLIHNSRSNVKVVFLTSHNEYMQDAFKVNAYRYLFKPFAPADIEEVLSRVIANIQDAEGVMVRVVATSMDCFVYYKDIISIEASGDFSILNTPEMSILNTRSMKLWMEQLDSRFFSAHRSHIINLRFIRSIDYNKCIIHLEGNKTARLTVKNKAALRAAFTAYVKAHSKTL